jgi:hypothetical protein
LLSAFPVGRLQAHLRERIDHRHLARMTAGDNVPSTAASLHGIVDRRTPLALDHIASGVGLTDDHQFLIDHINDSTGNRAQRHLAKTLAVFEPIVADKAKP